MANNLANVKLAFTDLVVRLDAERAVLQFLAPTHRTNTHDGLTVVFEAPESIFIHDGSLERGVGIQVLSYFAVTHKAENCFRLQEYRDGAFDGD